MKIEIEVVSTEIIPPSSPTPNDLSNYRLSFIDQIQVPTFMPQTLFYEAPAGSLTKSEISSRLKKSLSKTLSLYYPLAGRVVENLNYVNCNDQGITYVEARADCKLLDFINEPNILHELGKFLPPNLDDVTDEILIVQTTFFNCGGVAIGISHSHKIFDGSSISLFVNSWAAISRGDDDDDAHIQSPIFDGATLFPPIDLGGFDPRRWMTMNTEDLVTKRFRFTSSKINELRDIYTNTIRATRIEALTAFIWSRFMVSTQTKEKDDLKRKFNLVFPIDIRRRATPPLSRDLFGNFIQYPMTTPLFDGEEGIIVVEKMREAINSIDGDYINKLRDGTQAMKSMNDRVNKFLTGEVSTFVFTSLCRIPLYEADFGWGKPIWIGLGGRHHKNRVAFMDWVSEGGIESLITLKVEDMAKFEADDEFLAYAAT